MRVPQSLQRASMDQPKRLSHSLSGQELMSSSSASRTCRPHPSHNVRRPANDARWQVVRTAEELKRCRRRHNDMYSIAFAMF